MGNGMKTMRKQFVGKMKSINTGLFLTAVSAISVCSTCLFTFFMWKANEKMADVTEHSLELEKYRQTIILCSRFNRIYRDLDTRNLNDMLQFQLWENPSKKFSDSIQLSYKKVKMVWEPLGVEEKINELMSNSAFYEVFGMFEDAMMLNKKGLLDMAYFNNFFSTVIERLEETTGPSVEQIIDKQCRISKRNDIWDGYKYCRDKLIYDLVYALYDSFGDDVNNAFAGHGGRLAVRDDMSPHMDLMPAHKWMWEQSIPWSSLVLLQNKMLNIQNGCLRNYRQLDNNYSPKIMVGEIYVTEGDVVDCGDPVAEIFLGKVSVVLKARKYGYVEKIMVSPGTWVDNGSILVQIVPYAI